MTRTPSPTPAVASPATPTPAALLLRSLLPIVALALILGTTLWGPWVTLALTYGWWRLVTHFA